VAEGDYTIPLGVARIARPGRHVTLIAWGSMVSICQKAAEKCAEDGIECEIVDCRTLVPLDETTILESVKKTGRAVIVYEAPRTSGFGGEISAILAEKAIEWLEAPIVRVTGFDTPFPYALESVYLPEPGRIRDAVLKVSKF
jgi:2-oxoisovalerate dehydrogenase E1 component beta subunit